MRRCRFELVPLLLTVCLFQQSHAGDELPESSDDPSVRERSQTSILNKAELERWSFTSKEDGSKLKVSSEPVMRWSHFDLGRYYGDLHIITAQKRPVAIFAMFRWFHPGVRAYACATSLDERVVASRNGKKLWQPRASSLEWNPLPNAQRASQSPLTRLLQMRRFARRFSGEVSDRPIANRNTFRKLRLLPQPIYRYSTETCDGAIFAFSHGTNPAVLLCLEADLEQEKTGWRYGFARRWSFESRMKLDNQQVWTADSSRVSLDPTLPYYLSIIPEEDSASP